MTTNTTLLGNTRFGSGGSGGTGSSNSSVVPWNAWTKGIVIGSTILATTMALYYKYGPPKHPQVPNINAPYSWLFGHSLWLKQGNEGGFHEMLYKAYMESQDKYHTCVNVSIPVDCCRIFTTDPEILEFVFDTEFESFEKGRVTKERVEELLGDGIFTADPPKWKVHRKAAAKMFSMRNLKEYMYNCAVISSQRTIEKLKELNKTSLCQKEGIEMSDILGRFTMDSFVEISFGQCIGLIESAPKAHRFADAFHELVRITAYRAIDPFWRINRFFNWGQEKNLKEHHKVINEFVDKLMNLETRKNIIDETGIDKHDMISLYLSLEPNATEKELRDVALNMILAGSDTTRTLLTWFFYAIENKPTIIQNIKKEIDSIRIEDISYDQILNKLQYTECVLLETLRLYPPVIWSVRRAKKDITIPKKNLTIRKGEAVVVHHFTMGRNKDIWGDDVLVFNPSRWAKHLIKTKTPYEFVQFQMPPRLCLGRTFALMEAKTFVFYFFKHFDFKAVKSRPISIDHNEDHTIIVKHQLGLIMQIDEYYMRLTEIDNSEPISK